LSSISTSNSNSNNSSNSNSNSNSRSRSDAYRRPRHRAAFSCAANNNSHQLRSSNSNNSNGSYNYHRRRWRPNECYNKQQPLQQQQPEQLEIIYEESEQQPSTQRMGLTKQTAVTCLSELFAQQSEGDTERESGSALAVSSNRLLNFTLGHAATNASDVLMTEASTVGAFATLSLLDQDEDKCVDDDDDAWGFDFCEVDGNHSSSSNNNNNNNDPSVISSASSTFPSMSTYASFTLPSRQRMYKSPPGYKTSRYRSRQY